MWRGTVRRHEQEVAMARIFNSGEEVDRVHARWIQRANRDLKRVDATDEWTWNQCESCRYWFPLDRRFTTDWGVCSNALAASDGVARFAHDGCEHFVHFDDEVEATAR